MPTILWTGKLSLPMKLMVNTNNVLAWLTGNARDAIAMKQRIRQGYEGVFSDHVTGYDELGTEFQTKAAMAQLEELILQGRSQGQNHAGRVASGVGHEPGALDFLPV